MGKSRPGRPDYTHSVGALLENEREVRAWCNVCKAPFVVVDLARVVEARGHDFSLWNKRSRCRLTEGCKGTIGYHYDGGNMMFRLED